MISDIKRVMKVVRDPYAPSVYWFFVRGVFEFPVVFILQPIAAALLFPVFAFGVWMSFRFAPKATESLMRIAEGLAKKKREQLSEL